MRRNWSIRARLVSLGAAVALPLLLLLSWMFAFELRRETDEARAIALRSAKTIAERITSQHASSAVLLKQMARRPAIRDFDGKTCDSLFAIVDFFPQWSDLLFYDRNGALVCSARPMGEDALVSHAAQTSIADDLRAGRLRTQQPSVRFVRNHWMSVITEPVASGGSLVLLQYIDFIQSETPLPNTVVTILDRNGIVLARSLGPREIVGRNVGNAEVAKLALTEREGQAEARGLDGVSRQYGFTHLPALQWTVYAGVPTEDVMGEVRQMYLLGIVGGVLIILILTVAAFMLSRDIQKPVTALVNAAESAARAGYGRAATTSGPIEIARLSAAFNEMLDRRSTAEQNLKALSERLLTVQEQERMRVAREIHDDLGQALTALKMDVIGLVEKTRPSPEIRPMIDRILRTIDSTVTSVQRISSELRPSVLDDLGLFAAIESEARVFEERTGIECELSVPDELREVDSITSAAIYRIFQEALTNVARHSNASRVEIRVRERSGELFLEIRDDGRGIVSEEIEDPASFGLAGIRERADMLGGTALIEGIPGRGTIVSVRIPLGAQA
jgi:signal transduction histidine kinase